MSRETSFFWTNSFVRENREKRNFAVNFENNPQEKKGFLNECEIFKKFSQSLSFPQWLILKAMTVLGFFRIGNKLVVSARVKNELEFRSVAEHRIKLDRETIQNVNGLAAQYFLTEHLNYYVNFFKAAHSTSNLNSGCKFNRNSDILLYCWLAKWLSKRSDRREMNG